MNLKQFPNKFRGRDKDYLYTKGKELSLNGEEYIGEYHIISNTPKTEPVESTTSKILHPLYSSKDEYQYDLLVAKNNLTFLKAFVDPVPYIPIPTNVDYNQGFINRYFAKNVINPNSYVIEIDQRQYMNAGHDKSRGNINNAIYNLLELKWIIVGISKNVFESNTETLVSAEQRMSGIIYAVPNALQFHK